MPMRISIESDDASHSLEIPDEQANAMLGAVTRYTRYEGDAPLANAVDFFMRQALELVNGEIRQQAEEEAAAKIAAMAEILNSQPQQTSALAGD